MFVFLDDEDRFFSEQMMFSRLSIPSAEHHKPPTGGGAVAFEDKR